MFELKNKFVGIQNIDNVDFRERGNAPYITPQKFNLPNEEILRCRMESLGSKQGQVVRFVIMVLQIRVSSKLRIFYI
jgi:hypothetical protein